MTTPIVQESLQAASTTNPSPPPFVGAQPRTGPAGPVSERPRPTPQSRVAEWVAAHRDPSSRLLARGLGADLVRRRPPVLELYYEPGDPHSHLCAQLLPMLAERVRTRIAVRLVGESASVDYPEPERQRAYALADAARIAPARGLRFPAGATVPTVRARAGGASALAQISDPTAFAAREAEVAAALFAGGEPEQTSDAEATDALLRANASRRHRLGHYLPAVWQLDGDWFWGLDRLGHLEARLREHDLLDGDAPLTQRRPRDAALPVLAPPLPRSNSSTASAARTPTSRCSRCGSSTPAGRTASRSGRSCRWRCARSPSNGPSARTRCVTSSARPTGSAWFGRVADPLGDGARRCLQVFPLATSTQQQLDFLVNAGRAAWSEGVDLARDDGLRYVCERAGIAWDDASARIAADPDIDYAERNREDLLAAGLWGVPCYRLGPGFAAWGQDRFWMLPELLRRAGSLSRPGDRGVGLLAPDRRDDDAARQSVIAVGDAGR